jgi:hypothetical protein
VTMLTSAAFQITPLQGGSETSAESSCCALSFFPKCSHCLSQICQALVCDTVMRTVPFFAFSFLLCLLFDRLSHFSGGTCMSSRWHFNDYRYAVCGFDCRGSSAFLCSELPRSTLDPRATLLAIDSTYPEQVRVFDSRSVKSLMTWHSETDDIP